MKSHSNYFFYSFKAHTVLLFRQICAMTGVFHEVLLETPNLHIKEMIGIMRMHAQPNVSVQIKPRSDLLIRVRQQPSVAAVLEL